MTSMPASRSARAITFAPRSCPSSPGFATSTRIFCSLAIVVLGTQLGYNNARAESVISLRLHVEAAPQIPASGGAIRFPRLRDLQDLLRLRHFALAIRLPDSVVD